MEEMNNHNDEDISLENKDEVGKTSTEEIKESNENIEETKESDVKGIVEETKEEAIETAENVEETEEVKEIAPEVEPIKEPAKLVKWYELDNSKKGIIAATPILLIILCLILSSFLKGNLKIKRSYEFLDENSFSITGYSGQATASMNYEFQYTDKINEMLDKLDEKAYNSLTDREYKRYADQYNDILYALTSLKCQIEPSTGLSNGDEISVSCQYDKKLMDKAGLRPKTTVKKFIVEGLEDIQGIKLFDNLDISWSLVEGDLDAEIESNSSNSFINELEFDLAIRNGDYYIYCNLPIEDFTSSGYAAIDDNLVYIDNEYYAIKVDLSNYKQIYELTGDEEKDKQIKETFDVAVDKALSIHDYLISDDNIGQNVKVEGYEFVGFDKAEATYLIKTDKGEYHLVFDADVMNLPDGTIGFDYVDDLLEDFEGRVNKGEDIVK